MKKLLILAAAVAMGVMNAQAAPTLYPLDGRPSITFDAEKVTDFKNYTTAYIFYTEDYAEWYKAGASKDNLDKYSKFGSYSNGKRQSTSSVMLYYNNTKGGIPLGEYDPKVGITADKFIILVTDGTSYAPVAGAGTVRSASSKYYIVFENVDSPVASTTPFAGVTPTPEPTSGLLLLLGVAGLALRRKRA